MTKEPDPSRLAAAKDILHNAGYTQADLGSYTFADAFRGLSPVRRWTVGIGAPLLLIVALTTGAKLADQSGPQACAVGESVAAPLPQGLIHGTPITELSVAGAVDQIKDPKASTLVQNQGLVEVTGPGVTVATEVVSNVGRSDGLLEGAPFRRSLIAMPNGVNDRLVINVVEPAAYSATGKCTPTRVAPVGQTRRYTVRGTFHRNEFTGGIELFVPGSRVYKPRS